MKVTCWVRPKAGQCKQDIELGLLDGDLEGKMLGLINGLIDGNTLGETDSNTLGDQKGKLRRFLGWRDGNFEGQHILRN